MCQALIQSLAVQENVVFPAQPWSESSSFQGPSPHRWESKDLWILWVATICVLANILRAPGHAVVQDSAGPCTTHLKLCCTWSL